jgi:hypothetical protein
MKKLYGGWLLGTVFCWDFSYKNQETQFDFFVSRSHHGSSSAKTTTFMGNVQYVLTGCSFSKWCYWRFMSSEMCHWVVVWLVLEDWYAFVFSDQLSKKSVWPCRWRCYIQSYNFRNCLPLWQSVTWVNLPDGFQIFQVLWGPDGTVCTPIMRLSYPHLYHHHHHQGKWHVF